MRSIAQIRAEFPYPMAYPCGEPEPGQYCVGGAFCRSCSSVTTFSTSFPNLTELADAMWTEWKIDREIGVKLAQKITNANDAGHFDEAWRILEEAEPLAPNYEK